MTQSANGLNRLMADYLGHGTYIEWAKSLEASSPFDKRRSLDLLFDL
jgi:hypothetical protein